jgi:NAD(P) transhydrogenase subunit alpha
MRPGSVIVDMAIETGGNVEPARLGEEVDLGGVKILGHANLPGRVARTSSQMYSNNLGSFVEHFWDKEAKSLRIDPADPLLSACLITHGGVIVHETIRKLITP